MVYFGDVASNFWSYGISGGGQKFGICYVKIDGSTEINVYVCVLIKFRGKGIFDYFRGDTNTYNDDKEKRTGEE